MRILRYNRNGQPHSLGRLGCIIAGDQIADLRACYVRYLSEVAHDTQARELASMRFPPHVAPFLQVGIAAWRALESLYPWIARLAESNLAARGLDDEALFVPYDECYVHIASRPSKLICARWNFGGSESDPLPIIKSNSSVMGPQRKIVKPPSVEKLDFGANLCVVIGRKCKNVPESDAYDVIAGYTLLNDLMARDCEDIGRAHGAVGFGDLCDTLTPIGPWLVTRDEIADPMQLRITTTVNGMLRQDGNTREMRHPIPELIAMLSRTTLEPGDVIATGSPSHLPLSGQLKRYLEPNDVIQCTIEAVGSLTNEVIAPQPGVPH